jgi:ribosomal 50S subunit-recycling heat shock protein
MRVDLVLKYLCLVKSRSVAKALCGRQRVLVDGEPVRPSARLSAGRRVTVQFSQRNLTFELVEVPQKQLSKSAAVDYYRPVETPPTDSRPHENDDRSE